MKVKIKGLVFVGFAAAILSANAMAANEAQTVTSKAYTEATYQHKSTKPSIGGADGTWTDLDAEIPSDPANASANTAPTTRAVAEALDDLTAGLEVNGNLQAEKYVEIEDITDPEGHVTGHKIVLDEDEITSTGTTLDTASDNLVTENVIAAAVNAKLDHNQGTENEGKILVINSQGEVVPSGATGATTYQPYEAAANKVSGANGTWKSLGTSLNSSDNNYDAANAVTAATIVDALDDKQDKDTTNVYKVGLNGAWANVNAAVADTGTHITTTNESDGSVVINVSNTTNVAAGITASSTALTEGKAVYEYVQSITNGNTLPAQDPTVCTSAIPCALVNEAGNLNWRTMATATHAGGVCGNATGCTGSGDTGSGTSGNNNG